MKICVFIVGLLGLFPLIWAQPVHKNIAHDPTIFFTRQRPDFYTPTPEVVNDTTYVFECYDVRDSILNADTLMNFDRVKYISRFKRYFDKSHPYRDADGTDKPLPVANIVARFDRTAPNKWLVIEYPTNKMCTFLELKDSIVRRDSLPLVNPVAGVDGIGIIQYYAHKKIDF